MSFQVPKNVTPEKGCVCPPCSPVAKVTEVAQEAPAASENLLTEVKVIATTTSPGCGDWTRDRRDCSQLPCGSERQCFQLLFSDEESDVDCLMDAETSKQITCVQNFLKADKLRRTKLVHKDD